MGELRDSFFDRPSPPPGAGAPSSVTGGAPSGNGFSSPSGSPSKDGIDLLAAKQRLERGETIEQVANAYGITPRALKVRLGKLQRGGNPHASARSAIGAPSGAPPSPIAGGGVGVQPSGATPESIAAQQEIDRAIADFRKYITPEAIVDSIDGMQTSVGKMVAVLAEAKLTQAEIDLIPFEQIEKDMLKPWASFSLAGIETALRTNPALGMQIFLVLLSGLLVRRGIVIAYGYKRRKMLEKKALGLQRAGTLQKSEAPIESQNASQTEPQKL